MKRINLNKVAREVALAEAGKEQISIAQVKEVLRVYNRELMFNYSPAQILEMLERQ